MSNVLGGGNANVDAIEIVLDHASIEGEDETDPRKGFKYYVCDDDDGGNRSREKFFFF